MSGPDELLSVLPIMDHIEEGIVLTDDDFRITFMNSAAQRTFGVLSHRAIGKTIDDVMLFEQFQTVLDEILRAINEQHAWQGQANFIGSDGKTIPLDLAVIRLVRGEGNATGLCFRTKPLADQSSSDEFDPHSESFFRNIVELAHDGISIAQNGKVKYANLELSTILGYPVKDIQESPLEKFLPLDTLPDVADIYKRHIAGEHGLGAVETFLFAKSGSAIPVEITGSLITYQGMPASLLVIRDISKRKMAEDSLRLSEEKHRTLVENLSTGIYRSTIDDGGKFLSANPAVAKMFGYDSVEELVKLSVRDLYMRPSHRKKFIEELVPKGVIQNKELRLRKKDGSAIWCSITARIKYDEKGVPLWADGVIVDITERKQARQQLKESEETARALLNAPSEMAVLLNADGKILALNEYAARSLGGTPTDVIGNHGLSLLPSEMASSLDKQFAKAIQCGKPKRFVKEYEGRWFDFNFYPISGRKGRVKRMAVCVRNITKQKKAEEKLRHALRQAKEADLLKSRFLANMSHEIRTPLNAVIGLATILMLENDMAESGRLSYYKNIKHSAESLLAMINTILGLAKIESGTMGTYPAPFDIHAFLGILENHFRPQMKAKLLEFNIRVEPDIPDQIVGDAILLEQTLNNLTSNAFKFTNEGFVSIDVGLEENRNGKLILHFQIRDSGIGIPTDKQDRLFQAFFQVDGSPKRETQGTGLGLSIAKESVHLFGGKIWVESKEGVGTTFHFTFPVSLPGKNQDTMPVNQ